MAVRRMRYLTPTASHERLGLYCLGAGYQEGVARPSRGRVLDCYAAVFVTAGRGQVRLGDQEVRDVVAPVLFWLVPGVPHSYGPDSRGWAEHWVLFGGSATTGYEELGYVPRTRPVAQVVDVVPLEQAFAGVAAACHRDGPRTDPVVEAAATVHHLLVTARRCTADEEEAGTVLAALRRGACTTLSVADHARNLGLTPAVLRATVRRAAGCGPQEFLLLQRINVAKELLATSDLGVSSVARQVGYEDPAYFARIFSRKVGLSPTEFRSQQSLTG